MEGETPVGVIWFAMNGTGEARRAFLYDITLEDAHRGRGLGRQAMALFEAEARRLGLHVFGHNTRARELYEKLGYVAISVNLSKEL